MFVKRLLTVLVLVPLTVALILLTPPYFFQLVTAILCLIAAWEWATLAGVKSNYYRFVYVVFMLAAISVAQFIPAIWLLWVSVIWWLCSIIVLKNYVEKQPKRNYYVSMWLLGFVAIVPCWVGLNTLREAQHGAAWLLLFLFLLWATDSGAYLLGSKYGKRKLAPKLSPAKSIEGLFGGLLMMLLFAVVGAVLLDVPAKQLPMYFGVAVVTSLFAVIGDLFESLLKRRHKVKDSGNIFPGHGGMLDRMDSALAAVPIFVLLAILTGLI